MITTNKNKRLVNLIIDTSAIGIIYLILNQFFGSVINSGLLIWIVFILYYFLFELLTGQTPGKRITKTKVVNASSLKPKLVWILVRTLLRSNPFDALSYLFGTEIGTHDWFSKTRVVENQKTQI